jgi:putative phosphoesterase
MKPLKGRRTLRALVEKLRVLVVSDIHSNLPAFQSVLEDAGRVDEMICAGDIVGYGPDPSECVEVINQGFRCVAGNHDHALVRGDVSSFNTFAAEAISINRHLLDGKDVGILSRLPDRLMLSIEEVKVAVFHGSPRNPLNEYVFPKNLDLLAVRFLEMTRSDLLILGHTHVPYVKRSKWRLVVNPGSVGQPRDGDPRASYLLVDLCDGEASVTHRRVAYDVDEVSARMRRVGLPEILSVRLSLGR